MMKRKKQKEHIEVGPLERKLFVYLYGIKVAKSRQILRDVFTGYNIRSLQNRLNKLCRFKLIRRNFYEGQVAKFLGAKAREYAQSGARCPISLRTLEMGVEIAENEPESWQELLESAIPGVAPALLKGVAVKSSVDVLKILGQSGMKVSQQFTEFHQVTGMSRRSFFYQRKKLGLSHKRQESDYDGLSAEQ